MLVLTNPRAGRGGQTPVDLLRRRLRERDLRVVEMAAPDCAALRAAGAVVACGGDGTAHLALQHVVHTDVPLALLPTGTGNDAARALGVPRDPVLVADTVADVVAGRVPPTVVDTAEVTTADGAVAAYLTVLCAGFDSRVLERIARTGARSGRTLYLRSVLAELRSFRPVSYRVELDGAVQELDAMLVAVGNGSSYGGGMRICPAARLDDGLLDVMLLRHLTRRRLLRLMPTVYRGTHVRRPEVTTHRAQTVTIEARDQVAYADGERLGPLPVTVRAQPGSLRVIGATTA